MRNVPQGADVGVVGALVMCAPSHAGAFEAIAVEGAAIMAQRTCCQVSLSCISCLLACVLNAGLGDRVACDARYWALDLLW